jgi:predicted amidohydrolase
MTTLRVAAAQLTSGPDPATNLATATEAVRRAAGAGAELVALPEATLASFGSDLRTVAEPLDGPFATGLRKLAAELGCRRHRGTLRAGARRKGPQHLARDRPWH